ncbi:MAG: DUF2779 domain-containing protein [Chloroflexota bacterium]
MSRAKTALLSKSRYLLGLQCPRLLWLHVNEPERIPAVDESTQYIFDQGHEVGNLAKKQFPDGIDIPAEDFSQNLEQTSRLLSTRRPLFEAAFMSNGKYARVDILQPAGGSAWSIIEVKSSTSVKPVNYDDVAFQKHCLHEAGILVDRCFVAHIDSTYVRNGDILPAELFRLADVTEEVDARQSATASRAKELLSMMTTAVCAEHGIGPHCTDPYDCPLRDECWSFLPDHSVFTLHHIGTRAYALMEAGHLAITDLPADIPLKRQQRIQRDCLISGTPHIEPAALRAFLAGLTYPVYYLDFETLQTAIPLFNGISPYQSVPFQFSIHVVNSPGEPPQHREFLAEDHEDPRARLLESLHASLGDRGSIVAYYAPFEKRVLQELALAFPEYQVWSDKVCERMIDLLIPFRGFNYYHPLQRGSASLKAVLPALTGLKYEGLGITDGQLAGIAFLSTRRGMPPEEISRVRNDLLAYCGLDTEGMVSIVERLTELVHTAEEPRE